MRNRSLLPGAPDAAVPANPVRPGTELLRRQNLRSVLSALRLNGSLSHTDLSSLTGLASATVTALTADLEKLGAIGREEQTVAGVRGRPRVLFSRSAAFAHVVAVQIASDALHYALSDFRGTLIDRFSLARDAMSSRPDRFLAEMAGALERLLQRSRLHPSSIALLSLCSKGIVDPEGGRLLWSPVFGRDPVDFQPLLAAFPQAALGVENETLLVAQALSRRNLPQLAGPDGSTGLVALSLGHSIGLGIARSEGPGGVLSVTAPNFGHMLNTVDNRLCRCGAYGCVEATAGFYGILRLAFQVPENTIPAKFVPLSEMEKIATAARQSNRMAQYAFRQAGLTLGQGLSRVLSLAGNLPIVVTGPGTRFFDLLKAGMEEGLSQSLHVRLNGPPVIETIPDEQSLVFEGHLDRALTAVDERLTASR
ncbi:ROK family protein [Rhizobium sp. SGZ-381]|uniref:ROK family protein n=1 Tax=Rhizobium sp. SGZ-381 TaxID=3342800 RepID=UPI00366FBEC8